MFLLERLVVSMICGVNLRALGAREWDSIGCGKDSVFDVIPMGSRDVSLLPCFFDDLDDVSTGCGSARRGLGLLVSADRSFVEKMRLLLFVSSTGCGRGLRGGGGESGAIE